MKRGALPVLFLLALVSCSPSPKEVLNRIEKAAREGRTEEFRSYFTRDSAPFAESLLKLYVTRAEADPQRLREPALVLAASTVVEERSEGDKTFLTVETPAEERDAHRYKLVFRRDEGKWKLDLFETDRENPKEE